MELKTKIIWILWTIIYILNIINFRRSPIGYSNKSIMDISYSNIYFILAIIILCIQIYYVTIEEFSDTKETDNYVTNGTDNIDENNNLCHMEV